MKILVFGGNKHELYLRVKVMLKDEGIIFGVKSKKFGYDISIDDITIFVRQCNTDFLRGYEFDYYYTDAPMVEYRVNGGVKLKYLTEILRLVAAEKASRSYRQYSDEEAILNVAESYTSYCTQLKASGSAVSKRLNDAVNSTLKPLEIVYHKPNIYIRDVIYNDPATIVFWSDGTKTVVKADDEPYDSEKGLAMAIAKKSLGNKGKYYETFKKWLPKSEEGGNKDE